ncbi:MAG: HPr family phosphocarrier protein [Parachlamydiales bacterium]|nr:HPr family phosphocarrier protein [Parachlamydiales bacterium]
MKLIKQVKVSNILGLHIRPAAQIVKILQNVKSNVLFTYKNETINAKSIMSILMLAAKKNTNIIVTVEGSDAKKVMQILLDGFEKGFGEKS